MSYDDWYHSKKRQGSVGTTGGTSYDAWYRNKRKNTTINQEAQSDGFTIPATAQMLGLDETHGNFLTGYNMQALRGAGASLYEKKTGEKPTVDLSYTQPVYTKKDPEYYLQNFTPQQIGILAETAMAEGYAKQDAYDQMVVDMVAERNRAQIAGDADADTMIAEKFGEEEAVLHEEIAEHDETWAAIASANKLTFSPNYGNSLLLPEEEIDTKEAVLRVELSDVQTQIKELQDKSAPVQWRENMTRQEYYEGLKINDEWGAARDARLEDLWREEKALKWLLKFWDKEYEDDFAGQSKASFVEKMLTVEIEDAWGNYESSGSDEDKKYAQTLEALLQKFRANNLQTLDWNATLPLISQDLMGHLPQVVDRLPSQVVGGGIGLAAGFAVGHPMVGASAGITAATGAHSYHQMKGAAFRALIAEGVDEETASMAAKDEALISSLIEMADTGLDLASFGKFSALKDAAKKAMFKGVTNEAWIKACSSLLSYGINILGEGLEEGAQEAVSIANRNRLMDGSGETGVFDLAKRTVAQVPLLTPEERTQISDAAKEGMKIAALSAGGDAIWSGGVDLAARGITNAYSDHLQIKNNNPFQLVGGETDGLHTDPSADLTVKQGEKASAQAQLDAAIMDTLGQNETASEEVESTAVNTDPAQHTPEEQAIIEEYQSQSDEKLKDIFEQYHRNPQKGFARYTISCATERQCSDATQILGGDYSGYVNAINSNGVLHILNRHGPNGVEDHSMADMNDLSRIGYVLDNYDNVEIATYESGDVDLSAEFRTKDNLPAPMLKYSKKVNGTYYVIEAIPESKYKKFWVVSAYMEKADRGTQAPNAKSPGNTPNASLASSQSAFPSTLPQSPQTVNRDDLSDPVTAAINDTLEQAQERQEQDKRRQAYKADLSQYDAGQQETVRRAMESGILNDTKQTHEFVDLIAKIAADKGIVFDFTNNQRLKESGFAIDGVSVNGYVRGNGVTLNVDSAKALNSVVGHEITHVLEGTELYSELAAAVTKYAKTKGEYDGRVAQLTELYKHVGNADIHAEVVADLVGDYLFADAEFVRNLSVQHRNIFQKIFDEIKYLCRVVTAGSKEARQLEKVRKAFEDAYRAETKSTAESGDEARLSFGVDWNNVEANDTDAGYKDYEVTPVVYGIRYQAPERSKDLIKIGTMPWLYQSLFGVNGNVYISGSHLYQSIVSKKDAIEAGRWVEKADYHDLGEPKVIEAIMQSQDPMVLMESLNDYESPRLVAIVEEKGKDKEPLIVVTELYASKLAYGEKQTRNHVLITVYEKTQLPDYVKKTLEKGRILHTKKGLSTDTLASLQLAGNISEEVLKRNVAQFNKKVKAFKEKNKIFYSIGAASNDPRSYSHYQLQTDQFYPQGANGARPVDTPVYGPSGRPNRQGLNNALGAQIVTPGTQEILEAGAAGGEFEYDVLPDQEALDRAKRTIEAEGGGYDKTYGAVLDRLERGSVSKNDFVLAMELSRMAAQEGKDTDAAVMLHTLITRATDAAQAMQAMKMLRRLTPEGQLAAVVRIAEKTNAEFAANGKTMFTKQEQTDAMRDISDIHDTALRLLANIQTAFGGRDHGVPVEDWLAKIGDSLAGAISQSRKPGAATVSQTIKSDLVKFAKEFMPPTATRAQRTNTDILRDYFANREQYEVAWNQARWTLQERFTNDPNMPQNQFDFSVTNSDQAAISTVFVKAIAEEAAAQEIKNRGIDISSYLGDTAHLSDQIANSLIEKTQASEGDIPLIRQAVNDYIAQHATGNGEKFVLSDIRAQVKDMGKTIAEIIRTSPQEKTELANTIAQTLVQKYGISHDASKAAADTIIEQFNQYIAQRSEAALSSRFGKKRQRAERMSFEDRFRELANLGAFSGSQWQEQATQKLFGEKVVVDPELTARYLAAKDQDERDRIMELLYENIGKQLPATGKEKWDNWRYTAMLANVRTHVRNLAGNAGAVPSRIAADQLSALMQRAFLPKDQRTRALGFNTSPERRALVDAARLDYDQFGKKLISQGGKFENATSELEKHRIIFNNRVLEWARKKNYDLLEIEDMLFSKQAYVSALAGFLHARGFTAEDFTSGAMTEAQKIEARNFAVEEAKRATYRDANAFSDLVARLNFDPKGNPLLEGLKIGVEGVLPYKRTPANIAVRAFEYSPLGLAKSVFADGIRLKQGKITATQFLDNISRGLAGTVLNTALGALFSHGFLGIKIKATSDDEDQDELEGRGGYTLEAFGKSFSIDWLAPAAIPFFMGVELWDVISKKSDDSEPAFDKMVDFLAAFIRPFEKMSFMDGLISVLESGKYADDGMKAVTMLATAGVNYVMQGAPTLIGQLERALAKNERTRQTTFVDKNASIPSGMQYTAARTLNKVPFFDYHQVPYIDGWGRTQDNGNVAVRGFNNLINPAYVSDINETEVDREIRRLEEVLDKNFTPSRLTDNEITVNEEKVFLTEEEFITYSTAKGQNDFAFRSELIGSDEWSLISDVAKGKAQKLSEDYATILALQEAGFKPDLTQWQEGLIDADAQTVTETLIAKAVESEAEQIGKELGGGKYDGLAQMIDNESLSDDVAFLVMSPTMQHAYSEHAEDDGVSSTEFIDIYSAAQRAGDNRDAQRKAALDCIDDLYPDDAAKRRAAAQAIYAVLTNTFTTQEEIPNDWLASIGADGDAVAYEQMSDTQKEKFDSIPKAIGISAVEFADFLAFAENATSDRENGKEIPGRAKKDKIKRWLNVNIDSKVKKIALWEAYYPKADNPWR